MSELTQIVSPEIRLKTIEEWKAAQEAKEAALHGEKGNQAADQTTRSCPSQLVHSQQDADSPAGSQQTGDTTFLPRGRNPDADVRNAEVAPRARKA